MKLINLSTINAGHSFRSKIPALKASGVYIIQMKDISADYTVNWNTVIETKLPGRQSPNWLQSGDIVFAARRQRNYAVLIDDSIRNRQVVAAPQFFVIRLTNKAILPEYLAWFLNQSIAQRYFTSHAEGTQALSIRRNILEETPISLPSFKQQKIVIERVKTLHKEKALMDKIMVNSERLMQCLLNQLNTKEEVIP